MMIIITELIHLLEKLKTKVNSITMAMVAITMVVMTVATTVVTVVVMAAAVVTVAATENKPINLFKR